MTTDQFIDLLAALSVLIIICVAIWCNHKRLLEEMAKNDEELRAAINDPRETEE